MPSGKIDHEALARLHLTQEEHPLWSDAFAESTRCAQIEDDLVAARSVAALLMAIVTFGALLGTLGVMIATLT